MGTLGYTATVSLDGYVADADGDFQWSSPNDTVFAVHVDRMSEVSTEVLGRKTYALMQYWETYPPDGEDPTPAELEFARRWRSIEKVVVSSTLTPDRLDSDRARLVRTLSLTELRGVVDGAPGRVDIFGPTTAAEAIRAGMVEQFEFFVVPKIVGGGLRALPDDVRLDLELVGSRVFDNGTVHRRYERR